MTGLKTYLEVSDDFACGRDVVRNHHIGYRQHNSGYQALIPAARRTVLTVIIAAQPRWTNRRAVVPISRVAGRDVRRPSSPKPSPVRVQEPEADHRRSADRAIYPQNERRLFEVPHDVRQMPAVIHRDNETQTGTWAIPLLAA